MAKKKKSVPQLKVVFDTNALFTDLAHHLVSQDVREIIEGNSGHQDVALSWHMPEVVLFERTYQMQSRALLLLPQVEKVERLLGHNLAISDASLKQQVEQVVNRERAALNLQPIKLDPTKVDWTELCRRAAFREPPFEAQKEGKGFRDALIVESFMQLVEASPTTESLCRIALVTDDALVLETAKVRTLDRKNVRVLKGLEELKSLINTLVSEIPEELAKTLTAQASKMFFVPKDESTLYFRENIWKSITESAGNVLVTPPPNATKVRTTGVFVDASNFVKKEARRITWSARIHHDLEATKEVAKPTSAVPPTADLSARLPGGAGYFSSLRGQQGLINSLFTSPPAADTTETVVVAKSRATFEVIWSTTLGNSGRLIKASIDSVKLVVSPWGLETSV